MNGAHASGHAQFFHGGQFGFGHLAPALFLDEGAQRRIILRRLAGHGVLGRHRHIGRAHQGIRPRGVDLQRVLAGSECGGQAKTQVDPFRAADPVALHGAHLFRPVFQLVDVREQFLCVGRDADKPLVDFPSLDRVVTAPATAVHYLFVGQHSLVGFAPVDFGLFPVGQAFFKQAGEEPLLPAIVPGVAGGDLPVPVVGKPQLLQLGAHVVDILRGPLRRRYIVLDGGVFRRQAEGVPAHGLQHVLAQHALVAGDDIGNGVVAHVSHVQFAAGVGEHGQAVEFFPAVVLFYGETFVRQPVLPGGLFEFLRFVVLIHHGVQFSSLTVR